MKKSALVFFFTCLSVSAFASGHGLNGLEALFEIFVVLLGLNFVHLVLSIVALSVRRKALKIVTIVFGSLATGIDLFITIGISTDRYFDGGLFSFLSGITFISASLLVSVILVKNRNRHISTR